MDSEPHQFVSARRRSRARVIPLPRTATRQWRTDVAPKGRGHKWPTAALLTFEAEWLLRHASVLHLATYDLAETTIISLQEY